MGTPKKKPYPPDHRGPFSLTTSQHDRLQGRNPPSSCLAAPIMRVRDDCAKLTTYPDLTFQPDLTGLWEDTEGRFHLFLNQAGPHIEGLLVLVRSEQEAGPFKIGKKDAPRPDGRAAFKDTRLEKLCIRILADIIPDSGAWELFAREGEPPHEEKPIGTLEPLSPTGLLKVEVSNPDTGEPAEFFGATAFQVNDAPMLLDRYVGHECFPPEFRTALWFPLTDKQRKHLAETPLALRTKMKFFEIPGVTHATLQEMLLEYFRLEEDSSDLELGLKRGELLKDIDQHISNVITANQSRPATEGGVMQSQELEQSASARRALTVPRMPVGETDMSLRDALQVALERAPRRELRSISRYLGMSQEHAQKYEAVLEVVTGETFLAPLNKILKKWTRGFAEIAVLIGDLQIKKTTPPTWERTFTISLHGALLGKSFGKQFAEKGTGSATKAATWFPKQLVGRCMFMDVSVGGSVGTGHSAGATQLALWGSGPGRPGGALTLDFSDGFGDLFGVGGGLGLRELVGQVWLKEGEEVSGILPSTDPPEPENYTVEFARKLSHHYSINNSKLLPDGMEMLERFAATELVALSSSEIRLRVDGYADRPGDPAFNDLLSENRALNALHYLQAILPRTRGQAKGRGEPGPPNPELEKIYNLSQRRVDVLLDGDLTLTLGGPDAKPVPK